MVELGTHVLYCASDDLLVDPSSFVLSLHFHYIANCLRWNAYASDAGDGRLLGVELLSLLDYRGFLVEGGKKQRRDPSTSRLIAFMNIVTLAEIRVRNAL